MTARMTLSWPPTVLWPNSRTDRRRSTAQRQAYRNEGHLVAIAERFPKARHLSITFRPPTAGKRDLDNMLAAIKYGLDGIAKATGQDDSEWSLTIRKGDPDRPHGSVLIEAEPLGIGAAIETPEGRE